MRLLISFFVLFFGVQITFAQNTQFLTQLSDSVVETSGITKVNGNLLTFNDSGNSPILYEIDSLNGSILKETMISNAPNIDWEAICTDHDFIYIGDFGNNYGNRQNLRILKIDKQDYLSSDSLGVSADFIYFNYQNQTDFSSQQFQTHFDAEAMIPFGNNLIIFTKNWDNKKTYLYQVPKDTGHQVATLIDSLDFNMLVTDAHRISDTKLILVGYQVLYAKMVELEIVNDDLSQISLIKESQIYLPNDYSFQVESCSPRDAHSYYFTTEGNDDQPARLFYFFKDLSTEEAAAKTVFLYPNPSNDRVVLNIDKSDFGYLKLYDAQGRMQLQTKEPKFSTNTFASGIYKIVAFDSFGKKMGVFRLVVQ
ncbi:MAG: T9SS type A sorting domain-containing protein [Flavobacteriales bacterium]|nr:T9SS type A sorting domain-containing protein [Flavobacteriales bacterium]